MKHKQRSFEKWWEENLDSWYFNGCTPLDDIKDAAKKAWCAAREEPSNLNSVQIERLIEIHEDKFSETKMYGIPLDEINKSGLMACICMLGDMQKQDMENRRSEIAMREKFNSYWKRRVSI